MLKLCPFCGGTAILDHIPESYGYMPRQVWVRCEKCGASIPRVFCSTWEEGKGTTYHDAESEAQVSTTWNTRFPLQ